MAGDVDDAAGRGGAEAGSGRLTTLAPSMAIPYGGDRVAYVSQSLADAFQAGDRLVVVQDSGDLLHVPAAVQALADAAVGKAHAAFQAMGAVPDAAITAFFDAFASRLADDTVWAAIGAANAADVTRAQARGRSTTRLIVNSAMRADMISGLQAWRDAPAARGKVLETVTHEG